MRADSSSVSDPAAPHQSKNGVTVTVGVANDPISFTGNSVTPPKIVPDTPVWVWIVSAIIALAAIVVIAFFAIKFWPIAGPIFKGIFKGALLLVEAVLWAPYIVLVYPIWKCVFGGDPEIWPFVW